jgi:hypothetical protein
MDILKLKNLEDRIEFWNKYVERALKWNFLTNFWMLNLKLKK